MDADHSPKADDAVSRATDKVSVTLTPPEASDRSHAVARFRCTKPDHWTVVGIVSRSRRGLVISTMGIEAVPEEAGEPGMITASLLREIPTGEILARARTSSVTLPDPAAQVAPPALPEKRRPGRQPLSDALLREVAELYLNETAPGKPRNAIGRLAEHYGKEKPVLARWVMRARGDGWLGPAIPGREGGEPGPRLVAIRAEEKAAYEATLRAHDPATWEANAQRMRELTDIADRAFFRRSKDRPAE